MKKKSEYVALSTYFKEKNLSIPKGITPLEFSKKYKIEAIPASFKFKRSNLDGITQMVHFRTIVKREPVPQEIVLIKIDRIYLLIVDAYNNAKVIRIIYELSQLLEIDESEFYREHSFREFEDPKSLVRSINEALFNLVAEHKNSAIYSTDIFKDVTATMLDTNTELGLALLNQFKKNNTK